MAINESSRPASSDYRFSHESERFPREFERLVRRAAISRARETSGWFPPCCAFIMDATGSLWQSLSTSHGRPQTLLRRITATAHTWCQEDPDTTHIDVLREFEVAQTAAYLREDSLRPLSGGHVDGRGGVGAHGHCLGRRAGILESLHRQPPPSTAAEIQVALIENYLLT
jgi:hypothetical protein